MSTTNIFGLRKIVSGVGAVIKGWDIPGDHFHDTSKLPIVDLAIMTEKCPHDCSFCFTDKPKKVLSIRQIKYLIDQLEERDTYSVQYLGEGEPTLDENFFEIIEYTSKKGIIPIVFSESSLKLVNYDFVSRLFDSGASIFPKMDSLFNQGYQNRIVRSKNKTKNYFQLRNEAIELLIKVGFNKIEPNGITRLGFDMVLSGENLHEVEKTLRWCRNHNIYIMFAFPLTSGRTLETANLTISISERKRVAELVKKIDLEYGLERANLFNSFLTICCRESLMVRGDGFVQVCPGNETIIGNIKHQTITQIEQVLLKKFPKHNRMIFSGQCPYRPLL